MSIASAIQNAQIKVANAYTAVSNKGGTLPATQDLSNLPTAINSISGGTSFIGLQRMVGSNGVYQPPTSSHSFNFSVPSDATKIGARSMQYAFFNCGGVTSVDLSSIVTIDGQYALNCAFQNCPNLTSVDLSSIVTVSASYAMGSTFQGCTSLVDIDLSNLTTVNGTHAMDSTFTGCPNLTNVDLSSLTTINGNNAMHYTFATCTRLASVDLSNLTTISGTDAFSGAFGSCTSLTSMDLSGLTTINGNNAMSSTFSGCSNLESVSFTNLQTIGENSSSTSYGHFSSCFNVCSKLTTITFPNLEKIYCTGGTTNSYGTFYGNNYIKKMYFPKLDTITYGTGASATNQNACKKVFYSCNQLTELHFAAANQSAIEASPGYSTAWGRGAGNVTIYFDL